MPGKPKVMAAGLADLTKHAAYISAQVLAAVPATYLDRIKKGEKLFPIETQWKGCVDLSRELFLRLKALTDHYRGKGGLPEMESSNDAYLDYAEEVAAILSAGIQGGKRVNNPNASDQTQRAKKGGKKATRVREAEIEACQT